MQNVSADVYFFADADDVWSKKKVEKSLAALAGMGGGSLKEAQTGMGGGSVEEAALSGTPLCIFTDMYVTDERLTVTNNSFIRSIDRNPYFFRYQEIIMDNPAAGCTMCFNRACRDAAVFAKSHDGEKRFKEAASQVEMHDVWVLLTAALTGRVSVIDEPLVHYRQHWDNEMGAASETFFQKLIRNAAGLFDGSIAAKKKAYYDKAKSLAGAALLLEGVSASTRETLRIFCGLSVLKKPERIEFLKEKGFRREKHSLWIWLWA